MGRFKVLKLLFLLLLIPMLLGANNREKYNFNSQWLLHIGDVQGGEKLFFTDKDWKKITLPRAFNEDEAFKVAIKEMTDTVSWYRKHFKLPKTAKGKKVFIEFEGVRQGADFYLNGKHIGLHENGVMAVGFDLTPYLNFTGENVIAVRTDNDWKYKERATGSRYQWNDNNFNVNYGGIPKNVWLHITDKLYQTLPLYSNLRTTGVYIYATDICTKSRKAFVNAESEVRNEYDKSCNVSYEVCVYDYDGNWVSTFKSAPVIVKSKETVKLKAAKELENLHFWSWGYGYLYDVKTRLIVDNRIVDEVVTKTGFRKTRFSGGKIWLNDRVLQMKGYAQRTSNEWPAVGLSIPAWLSDYSNGLMVKGNANLVRWMHVTPWKQDVESCDRVGLIQAMPAGDAERDREGRQWEQRKELMRDAIIYNRNNPSILFYECGNNEISNQHMIEMKAIRDQYDPNGGRAIGSRNMLGSHEAEYGGEMVYINKSKRHPLWATEYCRDEALRKYWDDFSYPFHKDGDGPLYQEKPATSYNQNQDKFAVELVRRWYDYWRERPGTGDRVSSGGTKIIFSDTNTHCRGEENYRRSGVTDPMRIEKDGFFAHQVMWNGWVDTEVEQTYIIGHWNYSADTVKPVYVVSTGDDVELFLNGESLGKGKREYNFLFIFENVAFKPGKLEAVSYGKKGEELSRYALETADEPVKLSLTAIQNPEGFHADGADLALLQFEVVDKYGRRCPLDNRTVRFTVKGEGEWRGGIAQGKDNYILSTDLPVECGVNRALIRSTTKAGKILIEARAEGLPEASLTLQTIPVKVENGISEYIPSLTLKGNLDRGETPQLPSYKVTKREVPILSAIAGANQEDVLYSYDDNEETAWGNNGKLNTAWITYKLAKRAEIADICLKLSGFRRNSYPVEVYAGNILVWQGNTSESLGYIHLDVKPVKTDMITLKLKGSVVDEEAFSEIVELSEEKVKVSQQRNARQEENNLKPTKGKNVFRIIEIEFLEVVK